MTTTSDAFTGIHPIWRRLSCFLCGAVCRQEDKVDTFLREFERTKEQLPPDLVEYLQSYTEYVDLLYYYHCLLYTNAEWRKQERQLKVLGKPL